MNELQNLYEKINPKEAPETMAERIIKRSEAEKNSVKTRRPGWLAIAASIVVALIVAVPVTVSAMSGANIFDVFKGYFNTQELDPVGMVEYHKVIEAGGNTTGPDGKITGQDGGAIELSDYKLTINGLVADKHCVYISYDIEYKNPAYFEDFENGELRQELLECSPVLFSVQSQAAYEYGGGGSSGGRAVSVNGATVSYVGSSTYSNSFLVKSSMEEYRVKIRYECNGLDSDGNLTRAVTKNEGTFYASIPATKDITLTVNEEITCPDGSEGILNKIELNSLSIFFFITTKEDAKWGYAERCAPKLFFKDGTVLDIAENPERLIGGSGAHHAPGQNVKGYYYYLYETVIDPETIEAVEVLGKTYAVK